MYNALEMMNAADTVQMFKKPLIQMNSVISGCLKTIKKRKAEISFSSYIVAILKFYTFVPDYAKSCLCEIAQTHSEDESFEVLKTRIPFSLKAIGSLFEAYGECIKETNIVSVFAYIHEDSLKSEVIALAKYINKISGKVFENEHLQYNCFKFFSYIQMYKLEYFFERFLRSLCDHLDSLDDSRLADPNLFKIARHLAISGTMKKSLATRLLNMHISFFIKDHLSFLHLFNYHENPEKFYQLLHTRVLPEVTIN